MINKILSSILINGTVLYVIIKYFPEIGLSVDPISALNLEIVFLLGTIFWVFDEVVKRLVKVLIFPLMLLMSGIMSILINVGIFYFFAYTVNYLNIGIQIELGTFIQVLILSIIVALANLLLKKL
ncbi:phage holin family protein [Candidatus Vampirococcus lugosii]|uniref:Membrane protein, containing Mycobacterial 4 TMS phage holin, autolysin n=1 Tax=Candidatus Vampirococcus lugosii TaxID=2789015 RepID=A0ABS5QLY8_9BACT|nr:phage holin family protein [Candidatus Vampirococcus lugosii]MBS8121489.1 Membrane protein, containing Mycobacterial 4 TMS phage holin, autolysin [Candidatus Vampirococcus lugosii]